MRELIEKYIEVLTKIGKIIDYDSNSLGTITPMLDVKYWASPNETHINFDRYEEDDMEEYGGLIISSLGMKGEKLYHGESDGLYFVMAYDEDSGWDSAEVYIFDIKNKVE